jgi:hypothetical protein
MHSLQVIFHKKKILLIVTACRQIVINKGDKKKKKKKIHESRGLGLPLMHPFIYLSVLSLFSQILLKEIEESMSAVGLH